jgi:hypothetical protein
MHQVHHVGVMVFFGLLHAHLFVLQESTLKIANFDVSMGEKVGKFKNPKKDLLTNIRIVVNSYRLWQL